MGIELKLVGTDLNSPELRSWIKDAEVKLNEMFLVLSDLNTLYRVNSFNLNPDGLLMGHINYYEDILKNIQADGYSTITGWLYSEYLLKRKGIQALSARAKVAPKTIRLWLARMGLLNFRLRVKGGSPRDPAKHYWSEKTCNKNPNHITEGKTLRYLLNDKCVDCYADHNLKLRLKRRSAQ